MKPDTKLGIDLTTEQYRKDLINTATSVAIKACIAGDLQAHAKLEISIAENLVQQEALEYGKTYRDKLLKDGSSIINGKDVKWLNNQVESTRLDVYNVIEQGLKEGKPVASIGGKHIAPGTIAHDLEQLAIRDKQYEYARIARTETARIQNQGTLNRFNKNDITYVEVVDGDGCDACAEANGQIWTIEYAMSHELEHPNCVRAFIPIIPDDWEPPEIEQIEEVIPLTTTSEMNLSDLSQRNKLLKNTDREVVNLIDENDKVVASATGEIGAGYTDLPKYPGIIDPKRNLTLHHNHPDGGPFSVSDLVQLSDLEGVNTLWAHEKFASHRLIVPETTTRHDLWVESRKIFQKHADEIDDILDVKHTEAQYIEALFNSADKALEEMHDKGLIKYTKYFNV